MPRYSESRSTNPNAATAAAKRKSPAGSPSGSRTRTGSGDQPAPRPRRLLVPELHRHPLVGPGGPRAQAHLLVAQRIQVLPRARQRRARGNDLVQCGHGVPRAQLPGVLAVVGEVLGAKRAVLVADEPVGLHAGGVELHLDLHVLGDRHQRARELAHEHAPPFPQVVHVGVLAVPLVGDLLHPAVLEIAGAEAEHGEEDPLVPPLLDEPHHRGVGALAHVEVAVSGQDDPVVALGVEVLARDVVGQPEPGAAGRRAAGLEPLDRGEDRGLVGARRGREHAGPRRRRRPRSPPGPAAGARAPGAGTTASPAGSLSGGRIEPETSSRNTRLLGGIASTRSDFPRIPMRSRRCSGAHGAVARSVVTLNRFFPRGSG